MQSELKTRVLENLADAYSAHELRVNPEFQRGLKWSFPQRQGLIDSLLRGYQIPIFYVHVESRTNNYTGGVEHTAWIVDGQQRLAAIVAYRKNEFSLPNPNRAAPGTIVPVDAAADLPPWTGKKFEELAPEDRVRLLGRELLVVEMTAERNEVRDLFIRLQAGTPLTAQEKRDAWPGDFTNFVIRHAGKPGHPLSNPKRFFTLFPGARSRRLTVDDGDHYVDGLAPMTSAPLWRVLTSCALASARIIATSSGVTPACAKGSSMARSSIFAVSLVKLTPAFFSSVLLNGLLEARISVVIGSGSMVFRPNARCKYWQVRRLCPALFDL